MPHRTVMDILFEFYQIFPIHFGEIARKWDNFETYIFIKFQ